MNEQAIAIFCICDEAVKYFGISDDVQCKMTTSELTTFALLSAIHFCTQNSFDSRRIWMVVFYSLKPVIAHNHGFKSRTCYFP
jgi:hypothetical protein